MIKNIIIYTTKDCKDCAKVKSFLEECNISSKEKDLIDPEVLTELRYNGVFSLKTPIVCIEKESGVKVFFTRNIIFENEKISNVFKEYLEKESEER